ncbi:hypothetical protein KKD19_00315 [Patescibacteria group bacterium]|nr:hypothetical protein [Patescibacteria group bacterium]MBU4511675.1 hypothetical protein [Patescibacteria group bacterium]
MSNKKNLKLDFFFFEVILFLLVQIFGLFCGLTFSKMPASRQALVQQSVEPITWWYFIIYFLVASLALYLAVKFIKGKKPFKFFYVFLLFFGSFFVFNIWFDEFISAIFSFLILLLRYAFPRVLTHNLGLSLAVVGASVALGLSVKPSHVIIILIFLSIYDMIAVWKTKHMVAMFKGLVQRGVYFAIIIPKRMRGLATRMSQTQASPDHIFLGTGDIAFPIIFAVSALRQSLVASILIIVGALLGLAFIHFVFLTRPERKPVPALPPISVGCILGYIFSFFI